MENKDKTVELEDKKLSNDHIDLANQLIELRNTQCQKAAETVYNDLKAKDINPKEMQDRLIINPIDFKPVKIIKTEERLALFQEVDTLVEKYNNLHKLLEMNKRLEMNETHAVLFGAGNSHQNESSTTNETKNYSDAFEETTYVESGNDNTDVTLNADEIPKNSLERKTNKTTSDLAKTERSVETKLTEQKPEEKAQQDCENLVANKTTEVTAATATAQITALSQTTTITAATTTTTADEKEVNLGPTSPKQQRTSRSTALHHSMVVPGTNTPVRVRRSTRRASTIM